MKLRTGIVAATTAAAVMTGGAAVATAEPTVVKPADTATANNSSSNNSEGSSVDNISPGEIKDWVAVVSAIIAMLTQLFTLVGKFMR